MVYHMLSNLLYGNLLYGRSIRTPCFGDTFGTLLVFSEDGYLSCPGNAFLFLMQGAE